MGTDTSAILTGTTALAGGAQVGHLEQLQATSLHGMLLGLILGQMAAQDVEVQDLESCLERFGTLKVIQTSDHDAEEVFAVIEPFIYEIGEAKKAKQPVPSPPSPQKAEVSPLRLPRGGDRSNSNSASPPCTPKEGAKSENRGDPGGPLAGH